MLCRVLQHHLVKFAAHDLPGLRAFVGVHLIEIERLRFLPRCVDELHAVFLDEWAGLEPGEHAETLERPVRLRHERFADVEAREVPAFQQEDFFSRLGEEGSGGRAPGPAADDDAVVMGCEVGHVGFQSEKQRRPRRREAAKEDAKNQKGRRGSVVARVFKPVARGTPRASVVLDRLSKCAALIAVRAKDSLARFLYLWRPSIGAAYSTAWVENPRHEILHPRVICTPQHNTCLNNCISICSPAAVPSTSVYLVFSVFMTISSSSIAGAPSQKIVPSRPYAGLG